jgi:hypothetical protein
MEFNLNIIISAIIGAGLLALGNYLYDKYGKQVADAYAKNPQLYDTIMKIIRSGVLNSELLWLQGQIEDKKQYAIDYIQKELLRYGIDESVVDVDYIVQQIEIIVYSEFNKDRLKK